VPSAHRPARLRGPRCRVIERRRPALGVVSALTTAPTCSAVRLSVDPHPGQERGTTSNEGFLVGPMSVTIPRSTCEERVLLGLVEAMDLIAEENRPPAPKPSSSRLGNDYFTSLTSSHRAEPHEARAGRPATMRASVAFPVPWSPEDERVELSASIIWRSTLSGPTMLRPTKASRCVAACGRRAVPLSPAGPRPAAGRDPFLPSTLPPRRRFPVAGPLPRRGRPTRRARAPCGSSLPPRPGSGRSRRPIRPGAAGRGRTPR
jgi:hypothetical protein